MSINKTLIPVLFSSLLTGCWLGDYTPSDEIGRLVKENTEFCFQIKNASDYYANYLSIRERNEPEMSAFNRLLPALKIANNQLCIPQSYYKFPAVGEIRVEIDLRSPSKVMKRRYIVSEFRMVNGEPLPFTPRKYSTPTVDYMREKKIENRPRLRGHF